MVFTATWVPAAASSTDLRPTGSEATLPVRGAGGDDVANALPALPVILPHKLDWVFESYQRYPQALGAPRTAGSISTEAKKLVEARLEAAKEAAASAAATTAMAVMASGMSAVHALPLAKNAATEVHAAVKRGAPIQLLAADRHLLKSGSRSQSSLRSSSSTPQLSRPLTRPPSASVFVPAPFVESIQHCTPMKANKAIRELRSSR